MTELTRYEPKESRRQARLAKIAASVDTLTGGAMTRQSDDIVRLSLRVAELEAEVARLQAEIDEMREAADDIGLERSLRDTGGDHD